MDVSHRVRRSAHRNNGVAVAAVLVLAIISTAALAIAGATRHDTRTVVKDREIAGEPCIWVHGLPSEGCDRLAQLISETCGLRPKLCKATVTRALRSKSAKVRKEAARALGQGLAAAGIRGSLTKPTVTESARVDPLGEHKTRGRERASTNTPTAKDSPAVAGAPAARDATPAPQAKQKADSPLIPSVTTPSVSVPSVTTPKVPDAPVVTVPVPPEVPVVPPVTVPEEVPVPPVTIPDPLPEAKRPVCGIVPVHPCKPLK